MMGCIVCVNVLSDFYVMGIIECDNMLMLFSVSQSMSEEECEKVMLFMVKGFWDVVEEGGMVVIGG